MTTTRTLKTGPRAELLCVAARLATSDPIGAGLLARAAQHARTREVSALVARFTVRGRRPGGRRIAARRWLQ